MMAMLTIVNNANDILNHNDDHNRHHNDNNNDKPTDRDITMAIMMIQHDETT